MRHNDINGNMQCNLELGHMLGGRERPVRAVDEVVGFG